MPPRRAPSRSRRPSARSTPRVRPPPSSSSDRNGHGVHRGGGMLEDSNVRKGRGQEKRMESPGDLRLQGRGDRLAQGLEVRRMRSEKLPDGARVPLQRLALAERAGPKSGDRAGAAGQGNGSMAERAGTPEPRGEPGHLVASGLDLARIAPRE